MGVTLTSPIWLKIGTEAGNDLKLSHAKYFRTFISKKIAKNCVKVEFLTNEEKRIFKFVDPPDGHRGKWWEQHLELCTQGFCRKRKF